MASKRAKKATEPPRSLASIQVDVTNRLGAPAPATTTGLPSLDMLLGGGLRTGTHLLVGGAPGVGKTALVLLLAYMAARARASVLFSSVGLDDTEIVARLTARAIHREYHNVQATYGTIWSGVSMQESTLRGPISGSINTVVKKVGENLYLHAAEPMEDVSSIADQAAYLWARSERVVVVVDGAEAYSAGLSGASGAPLVDYAARLSLLSYELSRLAQHGCAVITTCHAASMPLMVPAATVAAELRAVREPARGGVKKRATFDERPMDLAIVKNRLGPAGLLPLSYQAAASVFEERAL